MTHVEFIELIRHPEKVSEEHIPDLKQMITLYPYFVPARLFLLKSLQMSNNMHFVAELKSTSIYCSNRRWLYYYLHPEKALSAEPYRREKIGKSFGDYFGMMNAIDAEGGDQKKSLKSLAQGLKSAREMLIDKPEKPTQKDSIKENGLTRLNEEKNVKVHPIETKNVKLTDPINANDLNFEISEENYKKMISQKKYKEAIGILSQLNLNNPKKSVYFADQIRFLEKVIENLKR